jgi:hypothetical protein
MCCTVHCTVYLVIMYILQEAQVCRQDLNNEQDLQEAQMYWRHGCIGGTCVQDAQV